MSGNDFIYALGDLWFGENENESAHVKNNWDMKQYLNLGGFLQQKFINNFRKTHIDALPSKVIGGNDNDEEINKNDDDKIDEFF